MTHRFLVEAGRWTIEGKWTERYSLPVPIKGGTIVAWPQNGWFTMATQLFFPGTERPKVSLQYRGHLNSDQGHYTFILHHGWWGQAEGEGWIGSDSIIQRYRVLGEAAGTSSFETFYRRDERTYHLCSTLLKGHYLTTLMEATLVRQL